MQGIKVIRNQQAALQSLHGENEQLRQTNSGLADHLQKLENSIADEAFPDAVAEANEPNSEPSDDSDFDGDDGALRLALQKEVNRRFGDMSSGEQKEWFRTRMQDPDFVAQLEERQREMEEYNSEEAEESDDDA